MHTVRTFLANIAALLGLVLTVPIIAIVLPLWATAFLTRTISKFLTPRVLSWQELIEFDPVVGWRTKPNMNTLAIADDVFHLKTDSQGWRGSTSIRESQVVVFGDSHAFGHGMDEKHLFTEINPQLRIKAIGANGYNMVQGVLWMRRLSSQLKDKLVVWFIFLGNDLYDNLEPSLYHYRIPFVREVNGINNWEIVTSHLSQAKWPFVSRRFRRVDYDRLTTIYSPNFVAQRAFLACEFLIGTGKEICSNSGGHLVVMTIPDPLPLTQRGLERLYSYGADPKSFDPEFPDNNIRKMCDKRNIPFVAGKDHLHASHYKERDDHWNQAGHKRVAAVLDRIYGDSFRANTVHID